MTKNQISNLIKQNENIKKMIGLPDEAQGPFDQAIINLQLGLCPMCGDPVKHEDFKDKLSVKEYEVSGLCAFCQDLVYNEEFWEGMNAQNNEEDE